MDTYPHAILYSLSIRDKTVTCLLQLSPHVFTPGAPAPISALLAGILDSPSHCRNL
ncbi:uncharacterized protein DS421_12g383410 [Arachis hypogaea]|nr:uncharacterized protein DS421_12g383410 [Arachis hypogaea]